jgi:RHS repeat-associated protein
VAGRAADHALHFQHPHSGTSSRWTDVLTTGRVITQNVTGLTPDTPYHWRVRLRYRPGNPLGQSASRWIHIPWNGWTETDFRTSAPAVTTRVITYTYDPLNRLTGADYSTGESFAYQYDPVGNRTVMTDATGVTTYTFDAANRLTNVGGVAYTWDARGNLVSDDIFTYTYSAAGRLVRAESVTVTLVYTYNTQGLRVAQSVDGDVITFAWDWASGVPEMLSEGGNLYLAGHDTLGRWDGSEWSYHLPDALGSVRQVADGAGAVTNSRAWTPFGVEVGAAQAGLGYTGEWWDSYLKFAYLRARWYEVETGRFTSPDPIIPDFHRPQTINRYAYVVGNPVNLADPTGEWICTLESLAFNPHCVAWVKDALHKLENQGGVPGKRLAAFFHSHDSATQSSAWSICTPILLARARRIWGIKVVFNPVIPGCLGGRAMAIPPDYISFNSTLFSGPIASLEAVALFGHEISHLEQGLKWFSVQSEMLTAILTYRLEDELGIPHFPEGEDVRIGFGTLGNPQTYDPWADVSLKAFKKQWNLRYPLRPIAGDLPKNWLNQWGVALFP